MFNLFSDSDSDPHRHREHGISYKLTAQGEKLVYESNEYCRLKIKGQQVWRCALKKRKQGRCPARLVQAPDGSVISVEEHVHPTDQYVKGPNLNIESGLRICSKSEVEDSDVSGGDKNVTTEKSSSNILSKVGVGLESVHNEGASVNNEQNLHKQGFFIYEPALLCFKIRTSNLLISFVIQTLPIHQKPEMVT